MNETLRTIFWTSACWVFFLVGFIITKLSRRRGADSDSSGAERYCRRAADNNRELAEQERATREIIEEAKRENNRTRELLSDAERNNSEAGELIREQAEDNRRAKENNRRAKELINRAKDILSSDSD